MLIGILGINHKIADLKLRELLARSCQKRFNEALINHGKHHFVLLSTCNRTEIYFSSKDLTETHSYLLGILREEVDEAFDQKLYSYFGNDCFLHLCRVTAGLDSAILWETEIQGQVKIAYEHALTQRQLPCELHYLFQKSLMIGKQIRTKLQVQFGLSTFEHAIFSKGCHLFQDPQKAKVLLIGASEINDKVASCLRKKQIEKITLCNRSHDSAQKMACTHRLGLLDWSEISTWSNFDWVICGTKSPHYLIDKKDLRSSFIGKKLIIDLSVPRNVNPSIGSDPRITLLNIDQINQSVATHHQESYNLLDKAESAINFSSQLYVSRFHKKAQRPANFAATG